jgi:EAL domain-containing protein (putative c-di-GMP-specific phosphodiesterase class I)
MLETLREGHPAGAPLPESAPRPYREQLEGLRRIFERQGSLGVLLVDLSHLARVEQDYGPRAFTTVHTAATALVLGLRGSVIRHEDVVATTDAGGDALLVFLSPRREGSQLRAADLQPVATRVEQLLNRKLASLSARYLRDPGRVDVGFAIAFPNPMVMLERLMARLVDEAWQCARLKSQQRDFEDRCTLQDVLLENRLSTVFQSIVGLSGAGILGYEALTRGPEGTPLRSPRRLFELAAKCDLVFELDRICRRRALLSARDLPAGAKLFLNVLPSAVYDPEFQGDGLLRLLRESGLSPSRIVLEITEREAIENYGLFAEALQGFTEMGFSIAVDDIGAGYSGLEKIAKLNPRYLKFDMELVKNIDTSYIRREMGRALCGFAQKMESIIIAEGIESENERRSLVELGIPYGQGYLLGRPGQLAATAGAQPTGAAGEHGA